MKGVGHKRPRIVWFQFGEMPTEPEGRSVVACGWGDGWGEWELLLMSRVCLRGSDRNVLNVIKLDYSDGFTTL